MNIQEHIFLNENLFYKILEVFLVKYTCLPLGEAYWIATFESSLLKGS